MMSTPPRMKNAFQEFSKLCREKFSDEDYEEYCQLLDDFLDRKIGREAFEDGIEDLMKEHDDLWVQFIILLPKVLAYAPKRKADASTSSATGSDDHTNALALPTANDGTKPDKDQEISPRNSDQGGNRDKKHDNVSRTLYDLGDLTQFCKDRPDLTILEKTYRDFVRRVEEEVQNDGVFLRFLESVFEGRKHGDMERTDKEVSEILKGHPELCREFSYHLREIQNQDAIDEAMDPGND